MVTCLACIRRPGQRSRGNVCFGSRVLNGVAALWFRSSRHGRWVIVALGACIPALLATPFAVAMELDRRAYFTGGFADERGDEYELWAHVAGDEVEYRASSAEPYRSTGAAPLFRVRRVAPHLESQPAQIRYRNVL